MKERKSDCQLACLRACRAQRVHPQREEVVHACHAMRGAAPHVQVTLEWHGLRYKVSTPTGPKMVLRDVSGRVMPGQLTALLGPSGKKPASA